MNHPDRNNPLMKDKETNRLEAFSDGIFAVAITLLALDIGFPKDIHPTNRNVMASILALWPKYFAYINSFATILLMWLAHHSIFKMIKYVNTPLIIANGFLMLLVVLTPFPTRVLGDYIGTDALKSAAVFYTGFFILISLAFMILWFVIIFKRKLLQDNITEDKLKGQTQIEFTGLISNFIITLISFFNPWLGLILNTGMWIYWIIKTT